VIYGGDVLQDSKRERMMAAMELFEVPIADTAVLSIVLLGNLVPVGVIASIYWYMTKKGEGTAQPVPMLRRTDRAA
jgi:DUF1365 family protein